MEVNRGLGDLEHLADLPVGFAGNYPLHAFELARGHDGYGLRRKTEAEGVAAGFVDRSGRQLQQSSLARRQSEFGARQHADKSLIPGRTVDRHTQAINPAVVECELVGVLRLRWQIWIGIDLVPNKRRDPPPRGKYQRIAAFNVFLGVKLNDVLRP